MNEFDNQLATAVVLDADRKKVLLHKREDFRIWTLPGGGVEQDETPKQAVIRETFEETGYQIEIEKLIGQYHRPQVNDIRTVFQGRVVGGKPIERGPETVQVAWFPLGKYPRRLAPSVSTLIRDTLNTGDEPIVKEVIYPAWKIAVGKALIRLRNFRNRVTGRG